jgi:hypothetical protein
MQTSEKTVAENGSATAFVNNVRKALKPLAKDDQKVDFVLTILEVRLEKVNEDLSTGRLPADEAFARAMRAMDKAIEVLTGLLGVSARLAFLQSILAVGTKRQFRQALAA